MSIFNRFKTHVADFFIIAVATLASASAILYFSARFTERAFGLISLQQILFNVRTSGGGDAQSAVMREYAGLIARYSFKTAAVIALIAFLSWLFITRRSVKETAQLLWRWSQKIIRFFTFRRCIVLLLLGASYYFLHSVDRRFHVVKFLKQEDCPFIENHYVTPDVTRATHPDGKKRNLIVIFLESMEAGYANAAVYGENLIPELESLTKEGLVIPGYRRTHGGFFTLDGISAQFLGVPATQLPINIHDMGNNRRFGGILKKSPSLFNVLKNDGYETASFHGTSRDFTHKGIFLKSHGIDQSFFAEDWKRLGYPLNEENRGNWDYNDTFLMERFKEWLTTPKEKPFAVFFETVNTHMPEGFTPAKYRVKGNQQEAVRYASRLTGEFIAWAKTQPWYADTTILIAGDHPWQDAANDFTKLTRQAPDRSIYNVFLNPARTDIHPKACGFAPMDMAPTILNAMGVEFTSNFQGKPTHALFGLGRSLFDDGENLVCRYGTDVLYRSFNEYSSFYNRLH